MRKVILSLFALALLSATSAFAVCVNFSGSYSCLEAESGSINNQIIEQSSNELVYKFKNETTGEITITDTFKIDGNWHIGAFGIWYKMACDDNAGLVMKMRGPLMIPKVLVETVPTETGYVTYRTEENAAKTVSETCTLQK